MHKWDNIPAQTLGASLDRRQLLKRSILLGLSLPVTASLIAACGGEDEGNSTEQPETGSGDGDDTTPEATESGESAGDDEDTDESETPAEDGEGNYGGALQVALIGEPPSLDLHTTTATVSTLVVYHIFEPLFTWDGDMQIMPELAESVDVSDDGETITLTLRDGINFHNGEVMTTADVVASIERWGGLSGLGAGLLDATDEITEVDDTTIEFQMTRPYGAFTTVLARQNQGCTIYPKSVIDEAGTDALNDEQLIGTGPYQFVERQPDRYILVERFEDYTDRDEEPSGYGGSKARYLDEIYFRPVPDEAGRIAGLQAGDYHYLESIVPDQFNTLDGDPNVEVEILPPTSFGAFVVNMRSDVTGDQTIRKALQAALDHEPILQGSYGDDFYRVDASVMFEETAWYTTAGVSDETFSPADPDRARELLEEAGYNGDPIRIICTQEYQYMYNFAVIAEQQLEEAGFEVELEVYDWATLSDRRSEEGSWEMFTTGITFRPDPIMLPFMQGDTWPGWWGTEEKLALSEDLQSESDFDTRFAIWERLQELFYEEVPMIKLGDSLNLNARSPQLRNFVPMIQIAASFYNVWLED